MIASSEYVLRDTTSTEGCFGLSLSTTSDQVPIYANFRPNYYIRTLSKEIIVAMFEY